MPDSEKKCIGFDFGKGDIITVNGRIRCLKEIEKIKNKIEKVLRTEFGKYEIYKSSNYGVNIKDLILGNTYNKNFTKSEIQREITDTLLQNEEITAINNFEVIVNDCKLECSFDADTIFGKVTVEL